MTALDRPRYGPIRGSCDGQHRRCVLCKTSSLSNGAYHNEFMLRFTSEDFVSLSGILLSVVRVLIYKANLR